MLTVMVTFRARNRLVRRVDRICIRFVRLVVNRSSLRMKFLWLGNFRLMLAISKHLLVLTLPKCLVSIRVCRIVSMTLNLCSLIVRCFGVEFGYVRPLYLKDYHDVYCHC